MSDYKMNTPIRGGHEVLWYRTLRALYRANKSLRKKEWLTAAGISYSDSLPKKEKDKFGLSHTRWPYRHWRGLYPAMFKHFQWLELVSYNCKDKKWTINKSNYELFCSSLNVKP